MKTKINLSAIFTSLILLCVFALPKAALAQADLTAAQAQIDTCNSTVVNNAYATAQKRITVANSAYSNMAQIDAAAYQCLDNIEAALNGLDAGFSLTSPGGVLALVAKKTAWAIALTLIQTTCSTILQNVKAIEGFALSQFNHLCIPLPKLNIGLGRLHLGTTACNGVNLLNPQLIANPNSPNQPGSWDLWGLMHKN